MAGNIFRKQTLLWCVLLAHEVVVLTVVLACADHTRLLVNDGVSIVHFGVPLDWLMQENWLTPPDHLMPYELSPKSPWEFSTTIAWVPFVLDALMLYALLLVPLLAARLIVRRRSGTPRA